MESKLKEILNTSTLKKHGRGGGGCINVGESYLTDHGPIFVKKNSKPNSRLMFDGELAGLNAILNTRTIRAPKPMHVLDNPSGGAALVMEYLDMSSLSRCSVQLGEQLAQLHLHNTEMKTKQGSSNILSKLDVPYVSDFGFDVPTCCGYIPQDNTWCKDWVDFFARQKLQLQIHLLEKEHGDREATELWSHLQLKLTHFFRDLEITPSLLHGDLWGGNVAEVDGQPVVFDPATFYGHSEFELSIASMFGGFNRDFYRAYHRLVPESPGFELRKSLYQLFHYLNHWNHFGGGYRGSSISIMKRLTKS